MFKTIDLLKRKISLTCIAKLTQVSITTAIRILKILKSYVIKRSINYLPKILMEYEFRSHTVREEAMNFIFGDNKTRELVDIFPSWKKLLNQDVSSLSLSCERKGGFFSH
ncbi:hypothetical protein [Vagococcus elongatus]